MVKGPDDSIPRPAHALSRWGRFVLGVAACGAAFACMETIVWATYSALDQKNFDVLQTFARPFAALSSAAALQHAAQAADTAVAAHRGTEPATGLARGLPRGSATDSATVHP